MAPLAVTGLGLSFLFGPITSAALRAVPAGSSGTAAAVLNTAGQIGGAVGLAAVGAVLQSRFVANVEGALAGAGLPPGTREGIVSGVRYGGATGGAPPAGAGGPGVEQVEPLIRQAFADATNASFLVGAAALVVGAALALAFFSSRPKKKEGGEDADDPARRPAPAAVA